MTGMEVTFSLFGFLAAIQLFTIGLIRRNNSETNRRIDTLGSELRAEFVQMRNDVNTYNQRLGRVEQSLARVEGPFGSQSLKVPATQSRIGPDGDDRTRAAPASVELHLFGGPRQRQRGSPATGHHFHDPVEVACSHLRLVPGGGVAAHL